MLPALAIQSFEGAIASFSLFLNTILEKAISLQFNFKCFLRTWTPLEVLLNGIFNCRVGASHCVLLSWSLFLFSKKVSSCGDKSLFPHHQLALLSTAVLLSGKLLASIPGNVNWPSCDRSARSEVHIIVVVATATAVIFPLPNHRAICLTTIRVDLWTDSKLHPAPVFLSLALVPLIARNFFSYQRRYEENHYSHPQFFCWMSTMLIGVKRLKSIAAIRVSSHLSHKVFIKGPKISLEMFLLFWQFWVWKRWQQRNGSLTIGLADFWVMTSCCIIDVRTIMALGGWATSCFYIRTNDSVYVYQNINFGPSFGAFSAVFCAGDFYATRKIPESWIWIWLQTVFGLILISYIFLVNVLRSDLQNVLALIPFYIKCDSARRGRPICCRCCPVISPKFMLPIPL